MKFFESNRVGYFAHPTGKGMARLTYSPDLNFSNRSSRINCIKHLLSWLDVLELYGHCTTKFDIYEMERERAEKIKTLKVLYQIKLNTANITYYTSKSTR